MVPAPERARLVPLGSVSLLTGVAYALVGPFLSLFLVTELHAGPVAVGAFLVTSQVAAVVASTLIGRFSDTRSVRRQLLVIGGATGALGYGVFAVSRSYWVLLAVSITLSAVASSQMPQMFAYARESLGDSPKAPLAISGIRTLLSVAWVAGTPLAAFLIAESGFTLLFAVSAGIYVVAALAAAVWLPSLGRAPAPRSHDSASPRGHIALAAVAFGLMQAATALGVLAMPLYVTENLGGSTGDAGLILSLCAAIEIPLMIWFGWLAIRSDHRKLVVIGAVTAIGYYAVVTLTTEVWQVAVAQVLNAVVISAVMGVGISYFQDLAPDRPGAATTLFTNTAKVSSMLAGGLLGLAQHLGYRSAYAIGLGLSVAGLAFLLATRTRHRAAAVVSPARG
ncbi:sugar efflux transporter [Actinokineospora sp. UTMC 2448]|uniref:sugar efflux transporter n=1 Tax=Actinokineospora sp. UTMC 2448 TaxID=2268449 RepID=UPI0021647AB8|nr:sugar efflux transporter [Actinokineospora sp. UTMC 2448]UVS79965.1 Sugar efflux transporter A [Actinokineospora sp. UTMC 2448]